MKNRELLNCCFSFPNKKKLAPQNYTHITNANGIIKRPIISEYHNELVNIVTKSKEK
jgi:hypothetical protein